METRTHDCVLPLDAHPSRLEPMTVREILEAAMKLEPTERELLVEELTASLHGGFASEEIEKAWLDEIDRRSREIDDGTAELVEWSDVRKRLAERRARRPS
jgi:putative addiction module component (TIGR02574 family)